MSIEEEVEILRERVKHLSRIKASLEKDLDYYRKEIEKLMSPPHIEAVVLEVLDDGRVVVKSTTGPNLIVNVAGNVDKSRLKPGTVVALNSRGSTIVEVLPGRTDPLVKAMEVIEKPGVSFRDIGGLQDQIKELYEVVVLPLVKPSLFREIGIEPPKGVLLHGPPGTGKTMLAKAVASETNAVFIRVVASEFVNKFIGEGARIVREVFRYARSRAPAIIFIDEIDAIGSRRVEMGTSGDREVQRTLLQLLAEIDGFDPLANVKVIAATNRLDLLDPALLRPGRFDRIIEVPLPDRRGRLEILKILAKKVRIGGDVDLEYIARITEGMSGAELKAVVTEAGYMAIRDGRKEISVEDMIAAVEKVRNRIRPRSLGGVTTI
ncbi:MAG: proteasome-activating nucleotidase [Desulfurococcales archaeon]|nr:proteasome-activating nucleotidase [Desulfurococcales archaeon]MCE4605360.1 proteasome-activating nucleotidase [Desulfurococcales archaeon]